MTWQQTLHEDSFTAKDFLFADGRQMDLRLAYRTLGKLASDKGNAVLLLHGTVGSGQQFLQPVRWTPSVGQESGRLKRESRRVSSAPPDPRECLGGQYRPYSTWVNTLILPFRRWQTNRPAACLPDDCCPLPTVPCRSRTASPLSRSKQASAREQALRAQHVVRWLRHRRNHRRLPVRCRAGRGAPAHRSPSARDRLSEEHRGPGRGPANHERWSARRL